MRLPGAGPRVVRTTYVEHHNEQLRKQSRLWASQRVGGKFHAVAKRRFDGDKCFDTKTYGCGWIRSIRIMRHRNAPAVEDRCQKCERMYAKERANDE